MLDETTNFRLRSELSSIMTDVFATPTQKRQAEDYYERLSSGQISQDEIEHFVLYRRKLGERIGD